MAESALAIPPAPTVFGVARSVLGQAWTERCCGSASVLAAAISQTHGLPAMLGRVLAGRGVGVPDVPGFLAPKLRDLMPDPSVLTAMDDAAARLADAVVAGERVAIFGDYDVDGACSAALLAEFLGAHGVPVVVHIPDRITEGYGPNAEAMRRFAEGGARLVVCVDCGTSGHEPIAEAQRLGCDVIVLDHHGAPETLPPARAIVNPNRHDDLSGLGHLAAAGIVFVTLVAVSRELRRRRPSDAVATDLLGGLDLVALATVCDVVPLTGLNRAFVRQGLAVMRARQRPGLAALGDVAGVDAAPGPWHLGYCLGPRINAGGRIGDSSLGVRLMRERDPVEAARLAGTLDSLNRERQDIERAATEAAENDTALLLEREPERRVVVAASADWHPGIVGLVASRLRERFERPAFAFALREDGSATGSGRSVPAVDLGRAVRAAVEAGLALKGGGHAMAAGATVATGRLPEFGERLEAMLASAAPDAFGPELMIDGVLSAGGATRDLVEAVERAGPFGAGQPEPVFAFRDQQIVDCREVGHGHVRLTTRGGDGAALRAIAFRAAAKPLGQALLSGRAGAVHLAGSLCVDRWGGGERVELRILDAAPV